MCLALSLQFQFESQGTVRFGMRTKVFQIIQDRKELSDLNKIRFYGIEKLIDKLILDSEVLLITF